MVDILDSYGRLLCLPETNSVSLVKQTADFHPFSFGHDKFSAMTDEIPLTRLFKIIDDESLLCSHCDCHHNIDFMGILSKCS